nr:AMP-binding protein [Sphingomonas sp. CDS-1]
MAELDIHAAAQAGNERPWLSLYAANVPAVLPEWPASPLAMFEMALAADPAATALYYFRSPMSYGELDASSRRLASRLAARGVVKGDRVAVLNQNTPATVIALVATWRLGAAIVPLNPMLTSHELSFYLADSGAAALLAAADLVRIVPEDFAKPVFLTCAHDFLKPGQEPATLSHTVREPMLRPNWERMPVEITPFEDGLVIERPKSGDLALLTYTSGTTGKSKGAMNSHGNAAFNAEVYRHWLQLGPGDIMLAAAPFSHVTGLIAHISVGFAARVPIVIAHRFEPATMLELIALHGCTTTVAAITAYVALMEHPAFDPSKLSRFTKLFSGGAPVAPSIVDRWEKATGTYIHNAYGLTETTSPSHIVPMGQRAPVDPTTGALSVGVPVPDTDCRIAGDDPDIGELLVHGPQVVKGYWHRPEESGESIVDGWLRTGDVCRRDDNGWFYIVDRAKDMIVASGFKIWPREVEDILAEHPDVVEAAVVGVPDDYRGERPEAYVVSRGSAAADADTLAAFCRSRLSTYKVPRQFHFVEALPKTLSGKVIRRMLKDKK